MTEPVETLYLDHQGCVWLPVWGSLARGRRLPLTFPTPSHREDVRRRKSQYQALVAPRPGEWESVLKAESEGRTPELEGPERALRAKLAWVQPGISPQGPSSTFRSDPRAQSQALPAGTQK